MYRGIRHNKPRDNVYDGHEDDEQVQPVPREREVLHNALRDDLQRRLCDEDGTEREREGEKEREREIRC
jgi:hypothetical protein